MNRIKHEWKNLSSTFNDQLYSELFPSIRDDGWICFDLETKQKDMYFPIGWPKYLNLKQDGNDHLTYITCNRYRMLFAVLTQNSISIWHCKVSILIEKFILSYCIFILFFYCLFSKHCSISFLSICLTDLVIWYCR